MKQYKNALLALKQTGSPSSLGNKFAKISVDAVDDGLRALANDVSVMYGYYVKPGWVRNTSNWTPEQKASVPQNYDEWQKAIMLVKHTLEDYVTHRISQGKPEWMVMAEKHGWRPPN